MVPYGGAEGGNWKFKDSPWTTLAGHPGQQEGGKEKWAGTDLKCSHS